MALSHNVSNYLTSFVNNSPDPVHLLLLLINSTESKMGLFFMRDGNTNHYECITHSEKQSRAALAYGSLPETVTIGKGEGLSVDYPITQSLHIPLIDKDGMIGYICLLNKIDEYNIDIMELISPLIGLVQLVIQNCRSRVLLKRNCQDLFLANMSHEIRTPLNGVIGYNQLLMQTSLTSTQSTYLSSMRQCSLQLMQIINDILDYFKLSSGKMNDESETFRTREIMQSVSDALDQSLKSKRQIFTCQIDDNVPEFLSMDKGKIVQIVMNLVSNANKFTDIGGTITLKLLVPIANILEIQVCDNGIGISLEDQSKIFNAFEQIQGESSRIGTGLGLAICRKLSNFLGGDIHVKSKPDEGSVFTVTSSFKKCAENLMGNKIDIKGKKILIVDDNIDNRILLSEILFDWETEPIICASAAEALRMVRAKKGDGTRRHEIDMGLIDICMPGTSGIDLAKQIKREIPLFPMIALSSVDSFIITKEFDSKLDKPINKVQLLDHICRSLTNLTPPAYIGEDCSTLSVGTGFETFNKDVKILIAEDINYNSTLLTIMLQNLGYNDISVACNGEIAITKLVHGHDINKPYEILLLDLRMPNKDGYEVIKEYKRRNWLLPKIIVTTASVMDDDRQRCKNLGVKYFINKPVQLTQLGETMLYVSHNLV